MEHKHYKYIYTGLMIWKSLSMNLLSCNLMAVSNKKPTTFTLGCSELGERKHLGIYYGGFVMAIVWQCLSIKALHIKYSNRYTWLNNCMQLQFVRFRHPAKNKSSSPGTTLHQGNMGGHIGKESHHSGGKVYFMIYFPNLKLHKNQWLNTTENPLQV